jgi:alpha-galactosidase
MKKIFSLLFILTCNLLVGQKSKNLALTPPMGWNSWNRFECDINEKIVMETADAIISSGMKAAGYEYIVIDDCWQTGRDNLGFIIPDPIKFPSGIKALADYIHSKGLKFGLYTCAGRNTCQGRPGSRGYEYQDALIYSQWGVDFLKEDWCNSDGQNAKESYTLMRDALYKAGRPVLLSICEWGVNKPWEWAADVGHMWRTTGDIRNNWNIPDAKEGKCWGGGVIINLDMQQGLEKFAGPGHWNDPDMLNVGNGVLSPSENRAHFSLWCILAAPLFSGNDIRNMNDIERQILTNTEVIAVDQDPLGAQGYKIRDYGEIEVFYKPLNNKDIAICIFNRFDYTVRINLDWSNFILKAWNGNSEMLLDTPQQKSPGITNNYTIRDLWKKENIGITKESLNATISGHDVLMVKLSLNGQ